MSDPVRGSTPGVLLVNLGTPDAPTTGAVRRYLREFLSDPRVVQIPRPLWFLILYFVILPFRPAKTAKKYALIWRPEGSPLRVHTEKQVEALRHLLHLNDYQVMVDYAMRYGTPGIPAVLNQLKLAGAERVLLMPMNPQYSSSTTATRIIRPPSAATTTARAIQPSRAIARRQDPLRTHAHSGATH